MPALRNSQMSGRPRLTVVRPLTAQDTIRLEAEREDRRQRRFLVGWITRQPLILLAFIVTTYLVWSNNLHALTVTGLTSAAILFVLGFVGMIIGLVRLFTPDAMDAFCQALFTGRRGY